MILSLVLLAQFCWEGQTCRPHVPIMPCSGTVNSTPCPNVTPTPTPRPTTTDTWGFDPGLKKDCIKRVGTDGNLTDIGHSCTPNWWVLNIAREGFVNDDLIRYADPTTDVSLASSLGVVSVTVKGTKDYPPPPTFTWAAFGEHAYHGGTSQLIYLDDQIALKFGMKVPSKSGIYRIAAGIGYEYGGKSWQLEANILTSPEWGDPDSRPQVISVAPAGMFNSYFAMLDAGYFGKPEPSDEWTEYIIDFKSMIDSFTDVNFPRPGRAKLVSVSVMAEVRENSSVTYDVKDLTVLTGQSATDALETSTTMVHWQTAKGKSYTIAAICPDLCSIKIDGAITTFRGSKTITFTAPVDRDGSVAVGGAAWSGLFKQGYSSDGVCQPLWPMVDSR